MNGGWMQAFKNHTGTDTESLNFPDLPTKLGISNTLGNWSLI